MKQDFWNDVRRYGESMKRDMTDPVECLISLSEIIDAADENPNGITEIFGIDESREFDFYMALNRLAESAGNAAIFDPSTFYPD